MKLARHAEIWLAPYMADRAGTFFKRPVAIRHIWLVVADHYEPFWNRCDLNVALRRVQEWRERWPKIAAKIGKDHAQSPPRYTFFYPVEQYRPEILDSLAEMVRGRIADVEVHIHHDQEGRDEFIHRMTTFCQTLAEEHGLLRRVKGQIRFGFIHGNWALDNSLDGRWCGLNDEITILRDLGCYADFTMPSGPSQSQARMINSIYWCTDDPSAPKSYDRGVTVHPGAGPMGDLLMIPGPFGLRWRSRLVPRMETGEIAAYDPPTYDRVKRWLALAPRIGEHAFLKLYTHGAKDSNLELLLSSGLSELYRLVKEEAEHRGACVHYVSAWQMYLAIEALSLRRDPLAAVSDEACFNSNNLKSASKLS
jgi:hypothetical protein